MKFGFVAQHRGTWPALMLCDMLGVSRSGFYVWLDRAASARAQTDAVLVVAIRASFVLSDRTYGARRILRDVRAEGHAVGLHHVQRLMRAHALRARPRRRALPLDTGERSVHAIAPNLLDRDFTASAPNQKWVADFTYLWTMEGWLYVAVVRAYFGDSEHSFRPKSISRFAPCRSPGSVDVDQGMTAGHRRGVRSWVSRRNRAS